MKIIKISSLACPSCIIMNKVFNKMKEKYSFDYEEYDYDLDNEDIQKFNPGTLIPNYIIFKDEKEVTRIIGEHSESEFEEIIKE